ncbi:glycosyltransferase, partial [Gilvibacter sp.]
MLSILIPTYNADLTALLQELHRQIQKDQLAVSVWVCDDASTDKTLQAQNKNISEQLGFNYLS